MVAKVEWHADDVFPRAGFTVTNLTTHLKNQDNQTGLQPLPWAYNLAKSLRRLALPSDVKHWSLTTLRERLVKIGSKVTRHPKYVGTSTVQLAGQEWINVRSLRLA